MNPGVANVLNLPFVQVALPILIGFVTMQWSQNKRFDDMGKRFDDMGKRMDDMANRFDARFNSVEKRLERIEMKLDYHADRLTRLEERTSLVR